MSKEKKFLRQCAGCREIKNKAELIKITKNFKTQTIEINQENTIQGRSVYICKNSQCLEKALKKNKIEGLLKGEMPKDIKEQLYAVLKN